MLSDCKKNIPSSSDVREARLKISVGIVPVSWLNSVGFQQQMGKFRMITDRNSFFPTAKAYLPRSRKVSDALKALISFGIDPKRLFSTVQPFRRKSKG